MDASDFKRRKKALKLTTAEVARMAELPVSTVSKIMTGETKNPSYITMEKIDKVLLHEEMLLRIRKYKEALEEYIRNHPEEVVDQRTFEKEYRRKNHLNDAPLPYAVPTSVAEAEGSLAKKKPERVSIEEYYAINEGYEDKKTELLDGHLIFNEAPGVQHQTIVQTAGAAIHQFIKERNGDCRVFYVGINVQLEEDDFTLLIPDIAVVCNPEMIRKDRIFGPPDLVVEVVSQYTRRRDYGIKMHKYMSAGVREYWIVDPEKEKVTVYLEGEPMMAYVYEISEDIPVSIYDGKLKLNFGSIPVL